LITQAPELPEAAISSAQDRYKSALKKAREAYSSASSAAFAQPTPPSYNEQLLQQARENYEAAKLQAEAQYDSWVGYASDYAGLAREKFEQLQSLVEELVYGKDQTYVESVKSRLSVAVYGTETPVWQWATETLGEKVAQATEAVGDAYNDVVDKVSEAFEDAKAGVEETYEKVAGGGNVKDEL
jgi:hypothetical protein